VVFLIAIKAALNSNHSVFFPIVSLTIVINTLVQMKLSIDSVHEYEYRKSMPITGLIRWVDVVVVRKLIMLVILVYMLVMLVSVVRWYAAVLFVIPR
jgi:hypothetical protein